jgi:hypothetical protein
MFSAETRSSAPRTRPAKQSSVYRLSAAGVLMARTGAAPPNVQANSPGSGRYLITSRSLTAAAFPFRIH